METPITKKTIVHHHYFNRLAQKRDQNKILRPWKNKKMLWQVGDPVNYEQKSGIVTHHYYLDNEPFYNIMVEDVEYRGIREDALR